MFFILNQNNENIKQQINGIYTTNIMQKKHGIMDYWINGLLDYWINGLLD